MEKKANFLGVTGSGKTYTMASTISRVKKPALIIAHNKTLLHSSQRNLKSFCQKQMYITLFLITITINQKHMCQDLIHTEKEADINEEIENLGMPLQTIY